MTNDEKIKMHQLNYRTFKSMFDDYEKDANDETIEPSIREYCLKGMRDMRLSMRSAKRKLDKLTKKGTNNGL